MTALDYATLERRVLEQIANPVRSVRVPMSMIGTVTGRMSSSSNVSNIPRDLSVHDRRRMKRQARKARERAPVLLMGTRYNELTVLVPELLIRRPAYVGFANHDVHIGLPHLEFTEDVRRYTDGGMHVAYASILLWYARGRDMDPVRTIMASTDASDEVDRFIRDADYELHAEAQRRFRRAFPPRASTNRGGTR